MTWAQIGELNGLGFEVGNHTWKHTHVTRMDRARFVEELQYIEEKLRSLGAPTPVSFAYPAYRRDTPDAVRTLRERGYTFARIGGGKAYDPARDDPLLIPSFTTLATNRDAILRAFRAGARRQDRRADDPRRTGHRAPVGDHPSRAVRGVPARIFATTTIG